MRRPLVLAALFHDLGRFEQLVRYNTFADDLSCNHGLLGARLLHELGFLQAEEAPIRRQTMALVALHNRFAMPAPLPEERRLALAALRDADKLDILRVMAAHVRPGVPMDNVVMLNAVDEPKRCSPAIVAALEEGRTALYRDIRFVNDFRLVLCTWLHDLHFSTSLRLAAEGEFFP
ncbi:HD domain-containing protein, partial [Desulfovibrio sp. OttesenSCG-928-M14]|nr:HD domain-containing protein [Desulfovibrio sp. OttesenSCG-928-M14]